MRHDGHSGFCVQRHHDTVLKWTKGLESSDLLYQSGKLQRWCLHNDGLFPIRSVMVKIHLNEKRDYCSLEMPYVGCESGFTFKGDTQKMSEAIFKSFSFRSRDIRPGFLHILKREIDKIGAHVPSELKMIVRSVYSNCLDQYPYGFPHGDFGFANMLVDDRAIISMVDFTPSFIYSPLVDIATMELSLFSVYSRNQHVKIYKKCLSLFPYSGDQIELLRMLKVLSFYRDDDTKERRDELRTFFYGWQASLRSLDWVNVDRTTDI